MALGDVQISHSALPTNKQTKQDKTRQDKQTENILPGHGVCMQVLVSRVFPLQIFPGIQQRVLVCILLPQVAAHNPKAVHCEKFSSPLTVFLAACLDPSYSSAARRCSISAESSVSYLRMRFLIRITSQCATKYNFALGIHLTGRFRVALRLGATVDLIKN